MLEGVFMDTETRRWLAARKPTAEEKQLEREWRVLSPEFATAAQELNRSLQRAADLTERARARALAVATHRVMR